MKKQQEVGIELKPTCAPQFMRIADQMGMKLRFRRGCLAGTSYCIISPRGKYSHVLIKYGTWRCSQNSI